MRMFRSLLLLVVVACGVSAAEIVAWNVPLSRLNSEGMTRRQAAPEASPFFKEGDELWDLKEVPSEDGDHQKVSLDWFVWNATSGRVVGKGDWAKISEFHRYLRTEELPRLCRLTVNVYEVAADGAPPTDQLPPVATLTFVVRSGQISDAEWKGNGKSMKVNTEVIVADDGSMADIRFSGSAEISGQPPLEINTAFPLNSTTPLWVARDFKRGKGLDLCVSQVIIMTDGSPVREKVMLQKGSIAESVNAERNDMDRQRVGEGWLVAKRVRPETLNQDFFDVSLPPGTDPFAEPSTDALRKQRILPPAPVAQPLRVLAPWLDHEVLDASEWLVKILKAPKIPGDFAGYDPIQQRFYFYSKDEGSVKRFEDALAMGCNLIPGIVVTSLDGNGQTRLVSRSGEKASLSRGVEGDFAQRSLKIEPTVGEGDDIIDIRLEFMDVANPESTARINSSATLIARKPLEIMSAVGIGENADSISIKAEVLRLGRE